MSNFSIQFALACRHTRMPFISFSKSFGKLTITGIAEGFVPGKILTVKADDKEFQVKARVDTPLEICEVRDPKGLYAQARRGEITLMQDGAFGDIYLKTPEGRAFAEDGNGVENGE